VTVALSGARHEGAARGAAELIAAGATHLLSFGLAGGIDPDLSPGTLLLPRAILTEAGECFAVDAGWHAYLQLPQPDAETAPILGIDRAIATIAEKAELRRSSGAVAIDMESHVLAETAMRAGRPFVVIRAICDAADAALPPAALVGVTAAGGTDLPAVLGSLLRRPGQLAALLALGRSAARAERALSACSRRIGPSLSSIFRPS
jgi:adenosylhomocysteine nucleosidase